MTCFLVSNSGKYAPSITFQSPISHALTSSSFPERYRFPMYVGVLVYGLSVTLDGMNILLDVISSFVKGLVILVGSIFIPVGAGSIYLALIQECPGPPGFAVAIKRQGTAGLRLRVAISLKIGSGLGKVPISST